MEKPNKTGSININLGLAEDGRPEGWFSNADGELYIKADKKHPGGTIVEVGTWVGRSLSYILPICKSSNSPIYVVDHWTGSGDLTEECKTNDVFGNFINNLKYMGGFEHVKIIRKHSIEAAKTFKDNSISVVLVDASHDYENVKADIDAWWPKLKLCGEMVGHDYIMAYPGIVQAVNERFGGPDETNNSCWRVTKMPNRLTRNQLSIDAEAVLCQVVCQVPGT